ncbi:hypothetical protein O6H91_02G046700 [Diphasiastrum complanatum]|nr:hypothetical protein O6H91_02G028500 [Diphasiastrum complanatum]KAJ7565076.1 hypothetical protein O6H91_02G046700 [Diphasiastrum complanatum]
MEVEFVDLLHIQFIAVRAWDAAMNTQPQELTWNVMGMMNNCWFKVLLNTCKPKEGGLALSFEHPTRPGNHSGGWMVKQKDEPISGNTIHSLVKSMSSPFLTPAARSLSMSEVSKHTEPESAWIVVHGNVYDCTRFLKDHPGGADSILINAGTDSTEEFDAIHSNKAKALLEDFKIGELANDLMTPDNSVHGNATALSAMSLVPIHESFKNPKPVTLNPKLKITCKLIQRKELTHNLRLFRFSLPSEDHVLGLPVGKHIFVSATIDGKLCMRAYTPISCDDDAVGYFELLLRVYYKAVNPVFPEGGKMSQHLNDLQIGQGINVKGPVGHIHYLGRGNFTVNGELKSAKKISMIAGGTGITPMYQIIKAILRDAEDHTKVHLIYANRTEEDIMLRLELEQWQQHHHNFKLWYVLSNCCDKDWPYSTGYITEQLLGTHLPEASFDTVAFICGPHAMIELACLPNLEKLGYAKNHCFVF